jgi:hypothetical protein
LRSLTVDAKSVQSAQALYEALSPFQPELLGDDQEGYRVNIPLSGSDCEIIDVLNVLQQHLSKRSAGLTRVQLDGHTYTMDAP